MESLSIGAEDARRDFAAHLDATLRGQHIRISRSGRPIAVLVPAEWWEQARDRLGDGSAG